MTPRSTRPRIDKHNHARKAQRAPLAVPAIPTATDLAELRSTHPDITDSEALLAVATVIDGKSMAECSTQHGWPPEWVRSSLAKSHVAAFCHELGVRMLGADAHLARNCMARLLHARSSYVRYAAAQDLMDRAGLRVRPLTPQPAAASITINIGTKPADGFVTTIDADAGEADGTHRAPASSSETV